uniref:Inheritance of peroxisomes protein 1 n=1 Tax=Acrobeloides nanus TaxID=290746 RepID=A0A914DYM3_9BILA
MRAKVETRLMEMKSQQTTSDRRTISEMRHQIESTENTDAEILFSIPDGVQLVVIRGEETAAPTPPTALEIFLIHYKDEKSKDHLKSSNQPKVFIKVGPWAYPLIQGQTPVLQNEYGIFVVPNPIPEDPNMCVGIILPRDQPKMEKEFVEVLKKFTEVRTSDLARKSLSVEEQARLSSRIANFLIKSGQTIALHVERGAVKTSEYIAEKGGAYRNGLQPGQEPANISPVVQHGVYYLHKGSKGLAKVTQYLLDKIGNIGVAVGTKVANSVASGDGNGRSVLRSTFTVAGGGIAAASTVWIALEDSSKILFKSLANETVETTRIRYGDQAAETSRQALYASGHATLAGMRLYDLGPRSIAGRVARKAGIEFVREASGHNKEQLKQEKSEDKAIKGKK